LIGLGLSLGWLISPTAVQSRPQATLVVYDEALASGWANWSWDATVNLNNVSPAHGGTRSIAVTYTGAWGALYLHADPAVSTGGYETLRFFIHGGSAGTRQLRIVANGDDTSDYAVTTVANAWTQIDVPLSALGSPATLTDLYWQDTTGGAQPIFYLDDIQLVGSGVPPTSLPSGVGPALSVDAQADQHPISPYIYGMNFADEDLAADLNTVRAGRHSTSFAGSVRNTGGDWPTRNIPDSNSGPLPGSSSTNLWIRIDAPAPRRS
jgi:hypothetical protein